MIGKGIETTTALSLYQVLDRIAAPIFIQDRHARVLFVNRALVARSRYTASQLLENARIFSAELREVGDLFTREADITQAGYLYDADGKAQAVSVIKSIVRDANGTPFIVATIEDSISPSDVKPAEIQQEIQERKAAEAALLRSQRRLTLLVQQSPFMFVEWNIDYTIQTWNAMAETVFGYPRSKVVGRSIREVLPELAIGEILDQVQPFVTQLGAIQQIQAHGTQTKIICDWYHYPLLAPNGNIMSIVSMGIDMTDRIRSETERQQAEVALLESEQRLSMLVQHAPMGIIEWTPEFTAKEWNPAAEKIFKVARNRAIGQHGNHWVPEQDQAKVNNIVKTLFECQGEIHSINQNLRGDGETIVCEWYNNQILDADGNIIGVVSMVRDISDRIRLEADREQTELALKQSEAQLRQQAQELESAFKQLQKTQAQLIQNEKMSSLGQLVAGIAHEINNPVSFIYGNVEYAKEYIEDLLRVIQLYQTDHPVPSEHIAEELEDLDLEFVRHDLMKLLDSMGTGAERIRDIVRSLRHFSRHDEADLKAVDLHEGIESALMLLQHLLKSNRACGSPLLRPVIQVVKDYGALPKVQCYAGLLNQVFINVFSNAINAINERWLAEEIDFTPEIKVQTSLFQQSDSTEWARISITDNGIGITDVTQRCLFDPFFTTKPVGQGSGLGLSVSYQIVTEQHGGRLSCDRPSKRGATFVIEIPVRQLMWS